MSEVATVSNKGDEIVKQAEADKLKDKDRKLTPQEIVDGFRRLREEQIQLAQKLREIEADKTEHSLVIETLKDVDGERRCFRLIGGVLVERTVNEVLPALRNNAQQLSKAVESLNEAVISKGREINEYREKYNIRIQGEDAPAKPQEPAAAPAESAAAPSSSGVLVDR